MKIIESLTISQNWNTSSPFQILQTRIIAIDYVFLQQVTKKIV